MSKLRDRIEAIARRELKGDNSWDLLASKHAELAKVQSDLVKAGRNLALVEGDAQLKAIGKVVNELAEREAQIKKELASVQSIQPRISNVEAEVESAMARIETLGTLAIANEDFASAKQLFDALNVRLFLKFGDEQWGKRTVRKPLRGVLTVGSQPPPIEIYSGPTGKEPLKQKVTAALRAAVKEGSVPSELVVSHEPHQEEDSLGNPHRGDRI